MMRWWRRLRRTLFARNQDEGAGEELLFHLEMEARDLVASGVPPEEARRQALIALGGVDRFSEEARETRRVAWLDDFRRDLGHTVRGLRHSPGLALVVVLTLALGIGGNTALFSILNSLTLRPLPVHEPARLVQLNSGIDGTSWTYPLWQEIRARSDMFESVAATSRSNLTSVELIEGDAFERLDALFVSGEFFDSLGIVSQQGRVLGLDDDVQASEGDVPVVLSGAFWRGRFSEDPDIVGRRLTLSRGTATVVGVAPDEFFGLEVGRGFDLALPITALGPGILNIRTFFWVSVIARLQPGQSIEAATSALQAIQPALRAATLPDGLRPDQLEAYMSTPVSATSIEQGVTYGSSLRARYQDPLTIVMGAVALVLLIACANIANLLLARSDARRHEISVRLALGASRGRLVRQLLVESALLTAAGAVLGLAIATWGGRLLVDQLSTPASPVDLVLPFDWRVLSFTCVMSMVTVLIFGVVPAVRATRPAGQMALVDRGRGVAGPDNARLANGLVVVQVALSLVLVIGAALLGRSLAALADVELGFEPEPVLEVSYRPHPGRPAPGNVTFDSLIEAVRAAPGVASAAFSSLSGPMGSIQNDSYLENFPGRSMSEAERHVFFRDVGIGWFDTMGMRMIVGRDFDATDTSDPTAVAILSEGLAQRLFPEGNPIGQVVSEVSPPGKPAPRMRIVGVVNDAVYNTARDGILPVLYRFVPATSNIIVRAAHDDLGAVASSVTAAIAQAGPGLIATSRPLFARVRAGIARERLVTMLSGFFAALALLLAGVGVYGVLAQAVVRRRSEIAVRRALGATDAAVTRLLLERSAWLVAGGCLAGLAASAWLGELLRPLLFGLSPRDPVTVAGAVLVLAGTGILAGWLPARRARRIDPAAILREG